MKSIRLLISQLVQMRSGIVDTLLSMIPQIVSLFTGVIGTILLARCLGPDGVGVYALVLSIPTALTNFSDLGIGATAIKFAARAYGRDDQSGQYQVLSWAFWLRLIILALMSLFIILFAHSIGVGLWKRDDIDWLIRISILISLLSVVSAVPTIFFQTIKDFKSTSFVKLIQILISFSGIVSLYLIRCDKPAFFILNNILTGLIGAVVFIAKVPRECFFSFRTVEGASLLARAKALLLPPPSKEDGSSIDDTSSGRFAIYMVLASVAGTISGQADIWLIGHFRSAAETGIYTSASKFALPILVLIGAVNTALWPRVANATNHGSISSMIRRIFPISCVLSFFCILYSLFFPLLIPFIFGPRFASGVDVGVLLCLRYSISVLFTPLLQVGYSIGMAKWYWKINIAQLFIVVALDIVLIPILGAKAAAIALIVSELVGDLVSTMVMVRRLKGFSKAGEA